MLYKAKYYGKKIYQPINHRCWILHFPIKKAVRIQPDGNTFIIAGWNGFHVISNDGNWIAGSPVTIGNMCSVALPVELLSFEGKNTEGGNLLTWATANEVNNKGFDVERSTGNGDWETLGFVKGNNKGSTYLFLDDKPTARFQTSPSVRLPSVSYYRLRQIDK